MRGKLTSEGLPIEPPYFHRWSWYKYFDENFLAYADPIYYFDDTVQIGWYVGNRKIWYLKVISKIIKKISLNRNINNNNILFYGSSGGGFASIELATLIKDSNVCVNNAQFFVMNFPKKRVDKLFEILRKSFIFYSNDEIYQKIKHRLSCIELFKKENYMPNIHYYVNAYSKGDINKQFKPFLEEFLKLPEFKDNLDIHFYYGKEGHNPMSNEKAIDIIKKAAKNYLYNDNSKINIGSTNFNIPDEFYIKSKNIISDGTTQLILHEIKGNIQNHIDTYVHLKKTRYNQEVYLKCLKKDGITIYKAVRVNSESYVNYWFEKNNHLFHFHTSTAIDDLDDTVMYMVKSMPVIHEFK